MNSNWFDWLARDIARGMRRRDAVRLMAGTAVVALFESSGRPSWIRGADRHVALDPDCDGFRWPYYDGCVNPVPKLNYTPSVNGCGPEGGVFGTGINAVPNSPYVGANFTQACNGHDEGYGTCNKPKSETDEQFLKDMQAVCAGAYGGGGAINSIALMQCRNAATTYYKAVSTIGDDAYKAGQEAACDCCECKGAGGKCLNVPQYRMLQERVVVFCKFLQANPNFQPTQPLSIAGSGTGNAYHYSVGEMQALIPVCTNLLALISQIQP
jgi:hypothetical protein